MVNYLWCGITWVTSNVSIVQEMRDLLCHPWNYTLCPLLEFTHLQEKKNCIAVENVFLWKVPSYHSSGTVMLLMMIVQSCNPAITHMPTLPEGSVPSIIYSHFIALAMNTLKWYSCPLERLVHETAWCSEFIFVHS